jgi:hypothetical protein
MLQQQVIDQREVATTSRQGIGRTLRFSHVGREQGEFQTMLSASVL